MRDEIQNTMLFYTFTGGTGNRTVCPLTPNNLLKTKLLFLKLKFDMLN